MGELQRQRVQVRKALVPALTSLGPVWTWPCSVAHVHRSLQGRGLREAAAGPVGESVAFT